MSSLGQHGLTLSLVEVGSWWYMTRMAQRMASTSERLHLVQPPLICTTPTGHWQKWWVEGDITWFGMLVM